MADGCAVVSEASGVAPKAKCSADPVKPASKEPKAQNEKAPGNDEKPEDPQKASAAEKAQVLKGKRVQRAKLGLEKLAAALPDEEATLITLPGPAFAAMSWTAVHPSAVRTSKIGVVLYAENFYVNKVESVPEFLKDLFQAHSDVFAGVSGSLHLAGGQEGWVHHQLEPLPEDHRCVPWLLFKL